MILVKFGEKGEIAGWYHTIPDTGCLCKQNTRFFSSCLPPDDADFCFLISFTPICKCQQDLKCFYVTTFYDNIMDRRQSKIHSLYLHCTRTQKGIGLCSSYGKGDIQVNVKFKYCFIIYNYSSRSLESHATCICNHSYCSDQKEISLKKIV